MAQNIVYIVFEDNCDFHQDHEVNIIQVLSSEKAAMVLAWTCAFDNLHYDYYIEEWCIDSHEKYPRRYVYINSHKLKHTYISEVLAGLKKELMETQSIPDKLLPYTSQMLHASL